MEKTIFWLKYLLSIEIQTQVFLTALKSVSELQRYLKPASHSSEGADVIQVIQYFKTKDFSSHLKWGVTKLDDVVSDEITAETKVIKIF